MDFTDTQKKEALKLSSKLSGGYDEKETGEFAKKITDKPWYHDFKLLYDMIRDKNYTLDKKTYMVIAGALAYVVFPVDIIPDMLLGVGFLDDAFVIGMVINQLTDEIEKYKLYKALSIN